MQKVRQFEPTHLRKEVKSSEVPIYKHGMNEATNGGNVCSFNLPLM